MIQAAGLLKSLWEEAIIYMVWLKNYTFTQQLGTKTPFEMFYKVKSNLTNVLAWGCPIKVYNISGTKLDAHMYARYWISFNLDSTSDGHCMYFQDQGVMRVE